MAHESKQPFSDEGYALLGAAFEVHNHLGGGLSEEIYQQALEIELDLRGIPYRSKAALTVYYKNRQLEKRYIPDLIVYERIVVEIKAVSALLSEHESQVLNYMRISRSPIGYLLNFGPVGRLEHRRLILSQFLSRDDES